MIIHCPGGSLAGEYTLRAYKPDANGIEIAGTSRQVGPFKNLITDFGLNNMGAKSIFTCIRYCRVGTGTTPPTNADLDLQTPLATWAIQSSDSTTINTASPYESSYTSIHTFALGAATGVLTEIGVGDNTSGNNLFSRSLIQTSGGVPTTLTVLADEILEVTYKIISYPNLVDTAWIFTDTDSTSYSGVTRAARLGTGAAFRFFTEVPAGKPQAVDPVGSSGYLIVSNGVIGAGTGIPTAPESALKSGGTNLSYVADTHYVDYYYNFALSEANLTGGISALTVGHAHGHIQVSISPPIMKTSTKLLSALTFRCGPWGRV